MAETHWNLDSNMLRSMLASNRGPLIADLMRRGQRVVNRAKVLCPVDNGTLRASITPEVHMEGDMPVIRIGSRLDYAVYVHEGTRYMAGRPFLQNALPEAFR
jgi:hypothetical protein